MMWELRFVFVLVLTFTQVLVNICNANPRYANIANFPRDSFQTKFIDLTHEFNNDTAKWPGRKIQFFTEFEERDENGIGPFSRGFCTSEHTSTHIDAPFHFNANSRRLNEIPFEDFIDIEAVMIDIYDKVHTYKNGKVVINENYGLTREDILAWEKRNGEVPQESVVLLRTGWESRWGNEKLFLGLHDEKTSEDFPPLENVIKNLHVPLHQNNLVRDTQFYDPALAELTKRVNFPAFDATAAKFLAEERSVRGVGVDTVSIDPGNQNAFPAHVIFATRNIYMLEMVANLHLLPPKGFKLWIVPFKIDQGTGAPTRVIARISRY